MTVAAEPKPVLAVRSSELFAGLPDAEVKRLERAHGNRDLMDLIDRHRKWKLTRGDESDTDSGDEIIHSCQWWMEDREGGGK